MENLHRLVAAAAVFAAFALAVPLADAQTDRTAPTIMGAKAISLNQIEVTFSEPVKTTTHDHVLGWTASGGDLGDLTIQRGTLSASKIVFKLNGNLPDTSPTGITLSYVGYTTECGPGEGVYGAPGCYRGRITDNAPTPNFLATRANIPVADGIAPTFTAWTTALNTVSVAFSEDIGAAVSPTGTWTLGGRDAGTLTFTVAAPRADARTLTLSSDLPNRNPDLTLTYNPSAGSLQDAAGNEPSGEVRVEDRIAPLKPAITTAAATVTSPAFAVSGTAEDKSNVTVYVGAAAAPDTVKADGGTWTKTVTLSSGTNAITATAADKAGNTSPASDAVSVVYAPSGTVITTPPATFNAASQTIQGKAPAGSSVSLYRDGAAAALDTGTADSDGNWSLTVTLAEGSNSITARSVKDGSTLSSAPVRFVLDTATHELAIVSSIRDEEGVFSTLAAPRDVEMFERAGKTYALVASAADSGLQLIDVTDPGLPKPVSSVGTSGLPFDIEIAEVGTKTFAIVATHRSGAVDFVDITDLSNISKVRTVLHDSADPADGGFLRLEGARSLDYFTVNSKHYVIVASDAGKSTLAPGGFLIMEFNENVATAGTRTAPNFQHVYSNHQKQTDENGDEVVYSENRGGYGSAIFEPHARFDAEANAFLPVTNRETIYNGYPGQFDVPRGGVAIYTWILSVDKDSNWKNLANRADNWNSLTDSQGRPRTVTDDGHPVTTAAQQPEIAPSRVLVMNDNDTPGNKSDDWLEASFGYGYSQGSIFRSPIAERQTPNDGTSRLVAVDANGRPFEKRGLDAAGNLFPALEGASSVDTFTVTENGSTKTYAAIAAAESDAVQIIDVSDPARPLTVKAVFDGDRDSGNRTFSELDGASALEIVAVNSKPHAVVASYDDDGFQIIDLSDPGSPKAASSRTDAPGISQGRFSTLDGANSVHTFSQTVSGAPRTYAMITSGGYDDDGGGGGFQLVDITNPGSPAPAGNGRDGERCSTAARYNYLGGASSAATAVIGGKLYSVVTGMDDDGIQLVRMDVSRRALTIVGAIADDTGGYPALGAPWSSEIAQINGRTYMFSGSYKEADALDGARIVGNGGGLQIIDVTNPARPQPAAGLIDTDNTPFDLLKNVAGVAAFERGGRAYAIVTAQQEYGYSTLGSEPATNGSFLILDVTDPENPRRAAGVRAGAPYAGGDTGQAEFKMSGPIGVDTAEIGAGLYAVIASNYPPAGVSIVDISNPAAPKPVAWIQDESQDEQVRTYSNLTKPFDVEIFKIGSKAYAIVTSPSDNGVQIIDISSPGAPKYADALVSASSLEKARSVSTVTIENSHTGNAEKTYAVVVGGNRYTEEQQSHYSWHGNYLKPFGYVTVIDVTDPTDATIVRSVSKGLNTGRGTFDIAGAYGVDTYRLGEKTYAAVTCGSNVSGGHNHCNGVTVVEITDPEEPRQRGRLIEETNRDLHSLEDSRGIDTFVSGTRAYSASGSFHEGAIQIIRLSTAADSAAPAIQKAALNPDRGILEITFDELVRAGSGNFDLTGLSINSVAGASATGALSGAELLTAADDTKMRISLSDADKATFAAAFEQSPYPKLDVAAAAFDDQAGNDVEARNDIEIEKLETSPVLRESSLDLGTGLVRLFFSEAVDVTPPSRVDLAKFDLYKLTDTDTKISLSSSSLVTGSDDRTLEIRLDEPARLSVIALDAVPVIDAGAGAVRGSEGEHLSAESTGNVFTRVYEDRTRPELVSAVRDSAELVLTFTEPVKVAAADFDLDQIMFYRHGDRAGATYLDDGGGLPDAAVATAANSNTVRITLTSAQTAAMGAHKDLVLEMVLDEGLSAVEDVTGYGIGQATEPLRNPDGTGPVLDSLEAPEFGSTGRTLTVVFSEGLWTAQTDPSKFHVRDGAGNADTAGQVTPAAAELEAAVDGSDTVRFALSETSADAIDAMSDPHLYLDSGAVRGSDSDPSAAASAGRDVSEPAQARPAIRSATALDLSTISVEFTKSVTSSASSEQMARAWRLGGPDSEPGGIPLTFSAATSLSSATDTLALTINGRLISPASDVYIGYDSGVASIRDAADSSLTLQSATTVIGGASTFEATATAPDTITVIFSDPVTETGTSGPGGWSISGPDSGTLEVLERAGISTSSRTLVLTLDGRLTSTNPEITLDYDQTKGEVRNEHFEISGSVQVSDGLAPQISSAEAVSFEQISVRFSEPMALSDTHAHGWSVSGTDAANLHVDLSTATSGSNTVVLTLDGELADGAPDVVLRYETSGTDVGDDALSGSGELSDLAGNALAAAPSTAVSDGIAPQFSARITGAEQVVIEFTEQVSSADNSYLHWEFSHADGSAPHTAPLSATSLSSLTSSMSVQLNRQLPFPTQDLSVRYLGAGTISDGAGNAVAAASADVSEDRRPFIESARATEADTVVVYFTKQVSSAGAPADLLKAWSVSGGDADAPAELGVSGVSSLQDLTRTLTLTLDGNLPDTRPDGVSVAYDSTPASGNAVTISDAGGEALRDQSVPVQDGIAPSFAASAPSLGAIRVVFSEPVSYTSTPAAATWVLGGADLPAGVAVSQNPAVSGARTALLTLSGNLADPVGTVTLGYDDGPGNARDASGNDLESATVPVARDPPPTITSARATELDEITVTFSEAVRTSDTEGKGWSVSGTDAPSLQVAGSSDISAGSATVVLTLSGNLADVAPDGVVLRYENDGIDLSTDPGSGQGGITDSAFNPLAARQSVTVSDGIPPTISTQIIPIQRVQYTFSETVNRGATPETFIGQIYNNCDPRTLNRGNGFLYSVFSDSCPFSPSERGHFFLDLSRITDLAGTPMGPGRTALPIDDTIAPLITRADATSLTTITVTFNESVTTTDTTGKGWSISGTDAGTRTVDSSTALDGNSVVLTLSNPFPDTKPDIRLRYETSGTDAAGDPGSGSGDITDQPYKSFVVDGVTIQRSDVAQYLTFPESTGNPLADAPSRIVSDRIAPTASFEATGDRTITVTFSEDVFVLTPHGTSDWAISGSDASGLAISSVSSLATPTDAMTVTLDGNLPARLTDFKLAYTGTAITDGPSRLAAIPATDVPDERGPSIMSAVATSPSTILVTFSREVSSSNTASEILAAWSLSGTDATVNNAPLTISAATSLSLSTSTLELTLSGNLPDTRPDLVLAYDSTPPQGTAVSIADAGSEAIPDSSVDVGDGLAPSVSSAQYTGRGAVLVVFGEPVKLESGNNRSGWTISGTDAGTATSASAAGLATSSATSVTLTLDGNLADKTLLDFTLSYQNGNITDESGNALEGYSEKPSDGFAPRILSAEIFVNNQARITYSEAVTAISGNYGISVAGQARSIPIIFGTGTDTHRVQFIGTAGTGAIGVLTIDSRSVLDGSGNALGTDAALRQDLADGQAPTFTAEATAKNQITVQFSENIASYDSVGQGWSVSGGDAAGRKVVSGAGSGSSLVLTLDSDMEDTKPDGVVLRYKTSSGDVNQDADSGSGVLQDGSSNKLAAATATVSDGIAPEVSSSEYVSRDTVLLTFTEPVKLSGSPPTGWRVSGADKGDATGASSFGTISTSVAASSDTMTLNNDLADKTNLDFTLSYAASGNIEDAEGNGLKAYSEKPSDGIRPEIESAVAGTLNSITVVFSEPVTATSTAPSDTWTLGGASLPPGLAVNDNPAISAAANRTTLGLDGNLPDPIGTVTLAYDGGTGDVADASGNDLASYTAEVMLDMPPSVSSARIAGPDSVVIQYSEPVEAAQSDYPSLVVGAQARTVSNLLGGTTAKHTIEFTGGDPFGTDATGSVSINAPNIMDATGNPLGTGAIQQPLSDGQSPTVSAEYTSRNSVDLTFSEPVRLSSGGAPTGWTVSGTDSGAASAGSSISVITTSVTSTSATLTLDGDLADKTLLDFTLSYAGGNIEDDDGNALAAYSATPDDGIAPQVSSSKYTSRNSVDLTFSEPVRLSSGGAPTGWTVSGTDSGAAAEASSVSVITTSVTSASATLTLNGNLADKTLLDFTLAYAATGNIEDQGGNALAAYSAKPSDGIAPKITSAKVTGPNQITVAFSEEVFTLGSHYSSIVVDGTGRTVSAGSQTGRVSAAVINFDGAAAGTDATGRLTVNASQVVDDANNALGTETALQQQLTDGQSPTFTARATELDEITVTFSENISSYDAVGQGWSVSGGDADGRTVASSSGSGSSLVLTLSSDLDDTKPDGVLLQYKTSPGDVGTDADSGSGVLQDGASNAVAARSSVPVSDGIAPEVSSAKYTARDTVDLEFSEPVRLSSGTVPAGWSATGTDVPTSPTAGSAITVLTTSATSTSATLTLDNDLADKTSLDFTLSYDEAAGNIEDESDNALAAYSEKPGDGFAPTITSAEATELDKITVTLSEKVKATGTSGAAGWSISGGDSASRLVNLRTGISATASDTLVLTLNGNLADTKPDGVKLAYDSSAGDVADEAAGTANELASASDIDVSDGIKPTVAAEATALNRITLTFSEPVSVTGNAQGWSISGADAAGLQVTASTATSSGLSTVLTLSGNLADTNPDNAVLQYKTSAGNVGSDTDSGSGAVADLASNALEARQNMPVSDGLAPTASFSLTGDRAVTVSFSEDVSSSDNDASHWTVSGADAAGRAISSVSSLTSATGSMTIALDGDVPVPSTDLKLAYSAGGTISDGAGLALAAVPATDVQDDRRPSVLSATAVNPNTIVVKFTRGVFSANAPAEILSAWSVSGGDAASPAVLSIQGASSLAVRTSSLTLTLNGDLPDTKPDGVTLSFDATPSQGTTVAISDTESRNLADASAEVVDGIAPQIESARVTGPSQITITYGEEVLTSQSHYGSTVSVGGSARSISGAQAGQTDTVTITFSGAVGTGATGSVSIDAARVADVAGNALGAGTLVQQLADGQRPTVASAKATALDKITVTFSEKVRAAGTSGAAGWSISGGDWNSRLVSERSDISSAAGSTTLVLTLNGGLADTKPEGVKLAYAAGSVAVADIAPAANELASASDIDVSDGIRPVIDSSRVTGPNQITIVYSETVSHNLGHYNNINVGSGRFLTNFSGANSDTAVLTFSGGAVGTAATGRVDISSAIRDGSNNALVTDNPQDLTDGQAPTFTAKATELDEITVTFSEALSVSDTSAQGWSVSGGDAAGRTVDSSTAVSEGNTVVLTLSSDMDDTKPDGVVLRYETSGADVNSDPGSGSGAIADPASNALEAKQSTTVSDGVAPEVSSTKYVSRSSVVVAFTEPVKLSGSAPTEWTVSGADKGDATEASSFGTISTSVAASSDTMTLDNSLADKTRLDFTLAYAAGGNLEDAAGNGLKQYSDKPSDGFRPVIVSAVSGELDKITVTFSEGVTATGTSGAGGWTLSGADSGSLTVLSRSDISAGASDSLTLTLSGNLGDPIGTVALDYDAGAGDAKDRSDNALASQQVGVTQDLAPAIASAEAVSASQIEVTFTETVTGSATDADGTWKLHGTDSTGRTVTAYPGASSSSVTLGISPALTTTSPSLQLQYIRGPGDIQDSSGKPLVSTQSPHVTVSDGIAPTIASARATSLNTIEVTFSEALSVSDTSAQGWSVSGGDAAGRTVDSSTAVSGGTTTVLTLSSDMEDTKPDGVLLQYKTSSGDVGSDTGSGSGAVADPSSNALEARANIPVSDGVRPAVESSRITGPNTIQITYGEAVTAAAADYTPTVGTVRSVSNLAGSGTAAHTLTFGGAAAGTGDAGTISINAAQVKDASDNALGTSAVSRNLDDGQSPAVLSATLTDRRTISVTFSEDVMLSGAASAPYGWALSGTDASSRQVSSVVGIGTGTAASAATLMLDGDIADKTDPAVSVAYSGSSIVDAAGNELASYSAAATDGIAPAITSVTVNSRNTIAVEFSEPVRLASGTVPTGWTLSGTDADSRTVSAIDLGSQAGTATLTLSGDILDKTNPAVTVAYSGGNLEDLAGNDLASYAAATATDGIAPAVTSATVTSRNTIDVEFSEPVRLASGTVPTGWTLSGADADNRLVSTIALGTPASTAELTLDGNILNKTDPSVTVAYASGNLEDTAGNDLAAYSAAAGDGIAPTILSAESRELDKITVTFSEDVDATSTNAASTWVLGGSNLPPGVSVSANPALSEASSTTLTLSGNLRDPIGAVTLGYDAGTGDAEDKSDNALASQTVTVTQNLAPLITSAKATARDAITVQFTEAVRGSATDPDGTWKLGGADATGITVSRYPAPSGTSVVLGLSGNLPDTDPDLSLQYVRTPGNVEDLTGEPLESTQPPHVAVSDGLAPALLSADLNEGTGVLALTFTEAIDVSEMNESSISIREQGASSGGVALSASARTTAADSATVSFTLSESDRQAVIAMTLPQLDMAAGAASDSSSNSSAAAADRPITAAPDRVPPALQTASLDEGTGAISLTFNERMATPSAAQAARIAIGTGGADITFAEADITSAVLDGSGTAVTITVSEAKRQEIIAATPADIDVLSGGLRDVSGAEASSSGTAFNTIAPDTTRPALSSAILNTDDGVLVLSFSETMDASSFAGELAKVSVNASGTPVQLAGTARADGTNVIVTLEPAVLRSLLDVISAAPNAGDPGLLSLTVPGAAPQFTDTSGNAVTLVSGNILIEDGRPPSMVSASVTSPGTIVVRFSEDLADDTVQTSDFSVPGYDVSSVSEMSGRVTITMANQDTFTVRDAPGVRTAGPVSDLFGNILEPGAQIQSVNAIMPVMVSQFTVEHDGPAKAGDRIQITFRAQGMPTDAALRVNGQSVATDSVSNGFDATYTVPSGAPQGPLSILVEIVSATGTPTEFSERDLTGPNAVIDTLPPSVVSASIAGIDSVFVIYSEPVTASAADYTGIEADGAAPIPASRVVGSGGMAILVEWAGAGTTPSSVRLSAGAVTDAAGNPAAPSQVTAAAAQTQVTLEEPGIPLARGTVVETVTAPSGIEPVVDVSSFTGTVTDAAVINAGGGAAVFESELRIVTRTFGLPDATFPAGTQAGGLGPLTSGGAAFGEAIAITSSSSTAHLSEDQREAYPLLFDGITTTVQVGHPGRDIVFDRPVLLEFDIPLRGALVFSVGTLGVPLPIPACDPSWDTSALPVAQSVPEGWPPGTYDTNACVDEDSDSVWTGHFSLFGVSQPPPRGGSECDDCTPPTLGYDEYGAKLVDAGFSYNGLASDVDYFFTPYPLIESEVGKQNAAVLKIYENEGPGNVIHASLAFGLRSGEVISESRAVINYDISHDGTGAVSVIDPDGAIDLDTLSAEHETVECSPGSELECLQVTITHTFRAPLEFDIVGTDVWDSQRNSWQNYYNHGIQVSGEPLDGRPGIEVNGGELVLHPISPDSTNRDVMMSSDGHLFKLSPDGRYEPLSNQSRLYHDIDESMYLYRGVPMQGYDRSDPEFRDRLYEQVAQAQRVLDSMMPAPEARDEILAPAPPDRQAEEERLRAAIAAEQERARLLFEVLFGYLDINGQN